MPARRAGSRLRGPVTRARPRRERTPLRRSSPRGVQKGRHPGTFLGGDRSDTQLFPSLQTLFCGTGEARAALALAYGPVGLVCHNTWWGWRQSLWPPRHWCLGGGGGVNRGGGGAPTARKTRHDVGSGPAWMLCCYLKGKQMALNLIQGSDLTSADGNVGHSRDYKPHQLMRFASCDAVSRIDTSIYSAARLT